MLNLMCVIRDSQNSYYDRHCPWWDMKAISYSGMIYVAIAVVSMIG